jgi:hypothetical protein
MTRYRVISAALVVGALVAIGQGTAYAQPPGSTYAGTYPSLAACRQAGAQGMNDGDYSYYQCYPENGTGPTSYLYVVYS